MAHYRTIQMWGQGYSTPPAVGLEFTPCTITATVDGNVVFSGAIPTLESSDIGRLPTDQQVLFSFNIPLVTTGNVYTLPVSLAVTGDDVFLEQINANFCKIPNPVYTSEQLAILDTPDTIENQAAKVDVYTAVANPPLSQADIDFLSTNVFPATETILAANNLLAYISSGENGYLPTNAGSLEPKPRSNVVITNAVYNAPLEPYPAGEGTWGYELEISTGQTATMTFDLNIQPGYIDLTTFPPA
jgi:hypothetical protein